MADTDWTQCPDCGWTGRTSELAGGDGGSTCPSCGTSVAID